MIWKKLKSIFSEQQSDSVGNELPPPADKISECYAEIDVINRWQGDIYSKNSFSQQALPTQSISHWMLANRTCQLYEGEGRSVKLPYLNFIAVHTLDDFLNGTRQSIKNSISSLVNGKIENYIFLPDLNGEEPQNPLVADFNLIYAFKLDDSPKATNKILQLSSPYCEHVFQRFSRFFYTVGYEDNHIKSKVYIENLVQQFEKK